MCLAHRWERVGNWKIIANKRPSSTQHSGSLYQYTTSRNLWHLLWGPLPAIFFFRDWFQIYCTSCAFHSRDASDTRIVSSSSLRSVICSLGSFWHGVCSTFNDAEYCRLYLGPGQNFFYKKWKNRNKQIKKRTWPPPPPLPARPPQQHTRSGRSQCSRDHQKGRGQHPGNVLGNVT